MAEKISGGERGKPERGRRRTTHPLFRCDDLVVDFAGHVVEVGGKEIALTGKEYHLLAYLARNARYILTTTDILLNVWGREQEGNTNLVQVTICRLREKLGDNARNPRYILTQPGIGYLIKRP